MKVIMSYPTLHAGNKIPFPALILVEYNLLSEMQYEKALLCLNSKHDLLFVSFIVIKCFIVT